ncbi:MAG: hypothetical protein ACRCYQ_00750 [Nocardioides sp.]
MGTLILIILGMLVISFIMSSRRRQLAGPALGTRNRKEIAAEFDGARKLAEEDITVFGEELQNLHIETMTTELDTPMRQDYQRALNSYETAKERVGTATTADEIKTVTHALEDGRYAMACVLARQDGEPLPTRRAPCFFNPQHGPSTTDIEWAPPGGEAREIPVCGADADRVRQGAEPDIRMVNKGFQNVPYWRGGPGYQPYAMGYYDSFASMMPMFFVMTMLNPLWMGGMVDDFGTGYDAGFDAGYDEGAAGGDSDGGGDGDSGGDSGGDAGGDSGGDLGGDSGGGGDWGGGDWGGFDGGGFDGGGF